MFETVVGSALAILVILAVLWFGGRWFIRQLLRGEL